MTTPEPLPASPLPSTLPAAPHTFVARDPLDVLAVVPVVLGFEPHQSVVMLTFGSARQFHARLDLPAVDASDAEVEAATQLLVAPVVRHEVPRVLLVVYTDDAERGRRCARSLVDAFAGAGVTVLDTLRTDGRRHWPALGPGAGTAYDVDAHPVRAQAVLDGRVTHRSRDDLAATLDPERAGRDDVAQALDHEPALGADQVADAAGALRPGRRGRRCRGRRRAGPGGGRPGGARRGVVDDDP